jgi:hypothetical protein
VSFSDEERSEFIATLTNAVVVADGLLEACRHLANALEWRSRRAMCRITAARTHLEHWRLELDKLKQRLASLTIEPPTRVQ